MEAAVVLPSLLLILLGIVEFGAAMWVQSSLQSAVEQAARCAAVDTTNCGSASAVKTYALGKMYSGLGITTSAFTVNLAATCGKQVSGSVPFTFAAAALFPYNITLTATSCRPT